MDHRKPRILFTSPVFLEIASHPKVNAKEGERVNELWKNLNEIAEIFTMPTRFPSTSEIQDQMEDFKADFIGCHLSHAITPEVTKYPHLKAVCTSTAGYNHIHPEPGLLITHTPSVLDKTVADFTISLILTNLRNLVNLHQFLWDGKWSADQKWDLDENLSTTLDNSVLGIVGLGEIGKEIVRRIAPWGVKILYYDLARNTEMEGECPTLQFRSSMEDIFAEADIVSLHIPLFDSTRGVVNQKLLKLMKPNALLINTARGPIVNFEDLLALLEAEEITIHLAFDVFDPEPISPAILQRFKSIAQQRPELRFLLIPHNASSDASTRARMSAIILEDLLHLCESRGQKDLSSLRLIPPQKGIISADLGIEDYRIHAWWQKTN